MAIVNKYDLDQPFWDVDLGGGVKAHTYCPSKTSFARAHKLLLKEPETIGWLDDIEPGSVMWDIGANVGTYTLYAALRRQCRVVAFEPASANYLTLNRNIELNALHDRVTAYCVAVAPVTGLDVLYMPRTDFGSSMSNYGSAVDFQGTAFDASFKQGSVGYRLDDLTRMLPFPSYIKIDVDGLERDIIRSGPSTLSDERLRSVIVELDRGRPELIDEVVTTMGGHGYRHVNADGPVRSKVVMNAIFAR